MGDVHDPSLDASLTWTAVNGVDPVRALRSAPVSILFLRPDLTIVDATDRYLADTMTTRDDIVGRPVFEVFPENPDIDGGDEGVSAIRSSLDRVRATGLPDTVPVQRYDIPRPDGDGFDRRYWSPVNFPVLDDAGEIVLIHYQTTDVTEFVNAVTQIESSEADRRNLEERFSVMEREVVERSLELHRATAALRASEERFRLVCDATSDALWDWDVAADRLWWSDGIERLFGYRPSELSPLLDSWTALMHPDDLDAVIASLHEALDRGDEEWEREYRFTHRDGHTVWVHDFALILRDEGGVAYRLVGGLADVTEHHLVEQQFLRAQRMENIGMVAGGIAHDLNNVLAPVLMGAELLALDERDPDRRQLLDTIVQSASRGAAMVQQILAFARGTDTTAMPVHIDELIHDVVRFVRETFPAKVRIEVRGLDNCDVTVPGDPTRLHQVLLNLCVNARDAMPGGGTLAIECDEVDVDESFARMFANARPGCYVVIKVRDSGVGMAHDLLDRIFEPFFSTKGTEGGTGLGLSTSEAIARDHGGFIRAESEVGRGSTFQVYLPTVSAARPESTERPAPPRGDGQTVLVVDDEESILDVTRSTLETHGYRVFTAASGTDAIATVATGGDEVRVVLVDMMMPHLDGVATIGALRHLRPDLTFVAVSGVAPDETLGRASELGVRHFVAKPYTAAALLEAVGAALTST